jgi:hypothetical protein
MDDVRVVMDTVITPSPRFCEGLSPNVRSVPCRPDGEGARSVARRVRGGPVAIQEYVGGMEAKDSAVRMILHGEQVIEGWSQWIVARAHGEPLPTITVPKPKKE